MRKVLFAVVAGLLISVIPAFSSMPPKSGATCSKYGQTLTYKGFKYTCIKSGKKLVWKSSVITQSTVSIPAQGSNNVPTPSSTSSAQSLEDISNQPCSKENDIVINSAGEFWCQKDKAETLRWAKNNRDKNQSSQSNENTSISPTPSTAPKPSLSPSASSKLAVDDVNGDICPSIDLWKLTSVGEFVCHLLNDGKLRWELNNSPTTPKISPYPKVPEFESNSYFASKYQSSSIENCKIKENSDQGTKNGDGLSSGFPFMPRFATYPKNMKMALIPIDFADLPGNPNIKSRIQGDLKMMSDWYQDVSGGKFTIQWQLNESWIRLPGKSTDYSVPFSGAYPQTENFWKNVIPTIDAKVDLTGIQVVNFILPIEQKIIPEGVQSFPYVSEMKKYNSSRTNLISFALPGTYFDNAVSKSYWSYYAHEFGHVIGLAHVGSSHGGTQTIAGYDLMGNQDGPYRELSGWMRFIIGWLDDNQVYCQDINELSTNELSLVPLNENKNGVKVVIIRTSDESAIVIDSRRPTKYSCDIPNLPGGVMVYTYDAKLGNQSYFLSAKYPESRQPQFKCAGQYNMEYYPDALLHKGDSISVGNVTVTVTSSGTYDQIKITKK